MTHTGTPPDASDARRRVQRLALMKAIATGLLVAMALVLAVIHFAGLKGEPASAVAAFAEASLIGGLADWFAVTALFRRPFGLPIPHTGIVPRNKDRIGRALGRFIVENFLAADVLEARLKSLELGAFGGRWLQRPANAEGAAKAFVEGVRDLSGAGSGQALHDLAGAALRAAAADVPAAPTAGALLRAAIREDRAQALLGGLARATQTLLKSHEDAILEVVQAQSWAFLPEFVDRAIARRVAQGLIRLLGELEDAAHPWRRALNEAAARLADQLSDDPGLRAAGEDIKGRLLADPGLAAEAEGLLRGLLRGPEGGAGGADVTARVAGLLMATGAFLEREPSAGRALNAAAEGVVRGLLIPRRRRIGRFIAEVVEGWNAEDLVDRLELQVGPDLQFIRINGAVVGGVAGLALHLVGRLASRA